MGESARIQSVEVLRDVKAALQDFVKEAALCITSVDADVQRVGQWLTLDRPAYWKHEVRKREELVEAAKAEIRRKELAAFPNPADTVLERKALKRAKERLELAMEKRERVRKWAPAWEREGSIFKGGCAPLNEVLHREIPQAIARLDRMMESLEEYFRLQAPATDPAVQGQAPASGGETMARNAGALEEAALAHPGDRYGPLRHIVPTQEERVLEAEYEMPRLEWTAGAPSASDVAALGKMDLAGDMPGPEETIAVSWRATREECVYLVRLPRVLGGSSRDSGWYAGPVERPETIGGTRVCTVGEILEQVPGLAPVLSFREGTLVVLHRGIIKTVLDADNNDVWGVGGSGVVR